MLTILIIEDNLDIRSNLVDLITEMELFEQIWQTETGALGLKKAKAHHPSVILCDVFLPDMSGKMVFQACKDHAETAFIPFIFLTGDPSQRADCLKLGADDFIEKPFRLHDLVQRLRSAIIKNSSLRDLGREEAKASFPSNDLVEKLSSISALAQLIGLDSRGVETTALVQKIQAQTRELVHVLRAWENSQSSL